MLDEETGELIERRLGHVNGEAREFRIKLSGAVKVLIEATGLTRWFERLLAELGHELWIGEAARSGQGENRCARRDVAAELLLNRQKLL